MRVAVFIKRTTFHQGFGGFETQNKVLCEGLAERGYQVTVFAPRWDLDLETVEEGGVVYKFVKCVYRFLPIPNPFNNWFSRSVKVFEAVHEKDPFDLAISQSSAGFGIIKNKKRFKIPVVSVSHGSIWSEFKTKVASSGRPIYHPKLINDLGFVLANFLVMQKGFVLGSNKSIAVSSSVKEKIVKETGVSAEKVVVINNGLDPRAFLDRVGDLDPRQKIEAIDYSAVRLIYVGRADVSKGISVLIKALNALVQEGKNNLSLTVVGDGGALESLKKEVSGLGLEEKVTFTGTVSHSEAISKLRKADIFVLPTLRIEGFPMTIPEAMFAGLPVIASDIGGNSDGIDDGETGFLVEPGSVDMLKEKIGLLIENAPRRKKMGESAKIKAQNEFSVNTMLDKYEQVFREVLG